MKIYSKTRNGEDNMGINGDQELKTSSAIKWYGQWWSEVSEGIRKPGYKKEINFTNLSRMAHSKSFKSGLKIIIMVLKNASSR